MMRGELIVSNETSSKEIGELLTTIASKMPEAKLVLHLFPQLVFLNAIKERAQGN
jgi:hypothetical protein